MLQIISEYIWPKLKVILIVIGVIVAIYFYIDFRKDSWEKYSTKLNYKKDLIEQIMAKLNDVSKDKNILGYDDAKINIIEYVNEMRDLGITIPITEESYKEYIEYVRTEPSNDTVDRGSR